MFKRSFAFRADYTKRERLVREVMGAVIFVLGWQLMTISGWVPESVLPSPVQVFTSYPVLYNDFHLLGNLWYSVYINLLSYAEAIAISIPLGFMIGLFALPRVMTERYITVLRYLPLPAATGLYMAWFGIGSLFKIEFLTTAIAVYLVTAVIVRIDKLDRVYEDTARTCGASRWQIIRTVYIPGVLTALWDDIIVLLPISWTYILVVEVINMGDGGIGVVAASASRQSRIAHVYAVLFLIMVVGFIQDKIATWLGKVLMPHRRPAEEIPISRRILNSKWMSWIFVSEQAQAAPAATPIQPPSTSTVPAVSETPTPVAVPVAAQEVAQPVSQAENIIELKDIGQTYNDGKVVVIKDLDLALANRNDRGSFIVIMGVSGCGKSTLLRYIAGLQEPTSGQVLINGKPRTDKDVIGMVFQQYSSFPWYTVEQNVALPLIYKGVKRKEALEQAREMIKTVGLEGHEDKYAQYPRLSGGQLQRVAIARSLINNPEVILMDEPFGALDTNTRGKMQQRLNEIRKKVKSTTVFVTHDITEAVLLADEIYIMKAGPGKISHKVIVDLPEDRNRLVKRDPRFIQLVAKIEDIFDEAPQT